MKTLKQIKNDYVRDNYLASHDLDTWFEFQNYFASRHPEWFEQHYNKIIELVQIECLKTASDNLLVRPHLDGSIDYNDVEEQITNEKNIIK